jgi:MFS family permease
VTLALTLPGDTLLYLLLPIYAASFGVSLPEAGALLAANRLVRIVAYGWIARLYGRFGPRAACLSAAVASIFATLCYATMSGLWLLLMGRLVWGLAYAAMNIANQALPTTVAENAARRTGRSRAIIALGPTLGLLGGAVLAHMHGPRSVFMVLAAVAIPALLFASRLPDHKEAYAAPRLRVAWPEPVSLWSFTTGFTLDGLFVFGLGLLAAASFPQGAVLAAGAAMALQYATAVLFSPLGGALGDRYGARRMMIAQSLLMAAGLLLLPMGGALLWVGAIAINLLRTLAAPLVAPVVAETHPGAERVPAFARQAAWRDIGAGTGPLAAGMLFPIAPAAAIYAAAAVLLCAASANLWRAGVRGHRT